MTFSTLYEACHNFFGWVIFLVVVRYANAEQLVNADDSKNYLPMSSHGLLLCMIEFFGDDNDPRFNLQLIVNLDSSL